MHHDYLLNSMNIFRPCFQDSANCTIVRVVVVAKANETDLC